MLVLSLIAAATMSCVEQRLGWDDSIRPDDPAVPANVVDFDPNNLPLTTKHPPRTGQRYRAIHLPPEITRAELERYRHTLTLSDEQFAVFESLYERYQQESKAFQEE